MTNRSVDWLMFWRWYHYTFFWVLLAVGILFRIAYALRFPRLPWNRASFFAVGTTVVSSFCAGWFPILPVLFGGLLTLAVGSFASRLFVAAPLIAVSLSVETAFIDMLWLRLQLKEVPKRSFPQLLMANLLITSTALPLVLTWALTHPIEVIA